MGKMEIARARRALGPPACARQQPRRRAREPDHGARPRASGGLAVGAVLELIRYFQPAPSGAGAGARPARRSARAQGGRPGESRASHQHARAFQSAGRARRAVAPAPAQDAVIRDAELEVIIVDARRRMLKEPPRFRDGRDRAPVLQRRVRVRRNAGGNQPRRCAAARRPQFVRAVCAAYRPLSGLAHVDRVPTSSRSLAGRSANPPRRSAWRARFPPSPARTTPFRK